MGDRLWISGYRSWELSVHGDADPKLTVIKYLLKNELVTACEDGLEWVITGGELGVEQWSLEVAIELRKDYSQLKTALMTPFTDFGSHWNETNLGKLKTLQSQVTFTRATSDLPYQQPAQLSGYNRFMAQHTDGALFLYDTDYPGKAEYLYNVAIAESKRRDYPVKALSMDDLEEAARELSDNS